MSLKRKEEEEEEGFLNKKFVTIATYVYNECKMILETWYLSNKKKCRERGRGKIYKLQSAWHNRTAIFSQHSCHNQDTQPKSSSPQTPQTYNIIRFPQVSTFLTSIPCLPFRLAVYYKFLFFFSLGIFSVKFPMTFCCALPMHQFAMPLSQQASRSLLGDSFIAYFNIKNFKKESLDFWTWFKRRRVPKLMRSCSLDGASFVFDSLIH